MSRSSARALQLLGRWSQLSQRHLPLSAGCSCGAPVVHVRIADMENDLLAFLQKRHPNAPRTSSISELLRAIAQKPFANSDALLSELERSLDSFGEIHR